MVSAEDVALLIKLQKRIKYLETTKQKLADELEERDDLEERALDGDFAFHSLKVVRQFGDLQCNLGVEETNKLTYIVCTVS